MRISGGQWRSRRLQGPGKQLNLRPTPDAMRERAFAVLADRVQGARFLDLYAGTGAVGLEALSRGARSAVFVEKSRNAGRLIGKNIASFELSTERAELVTRAAATAIRELERRGETFDIAWVDPPFEIWREGLTLVVELFEVGLLGATSLACLECPEKAEVAASLPPNIEIARDLAGGASRVVMVEFADQSR